jgi:hypothetical protein
MTDSAVRTYSVGDVLPQEERVPTQDWCEETLAGGYYCSLRKGHTGPQHVATYASGSVVAVVDRDTSADEPKRYAVGDTAPLSIRASEQGVPYCGESADTVGHYYTCSLPRDHDGPQHLTIDGASGVVVAAVDREPAPEPIVEQPTPEVLAERLAAAVEVNTNLDRQLREARDELVSLQNTHDEFRDTVRSTAIRLAKQHDWCSVVDSALREMGLEPMRQDYDVEVSVTATRTITVRMEGVDLDGVDPSAVKEQLSWHRVDNAFREQESDSGWSTSSYEVEEWSVADD